MNDLWKYLVESGISLCLFYVIYWIFLRRDTFFSRNRFYLALSILLSMVIPLLTISVHQPAPIYTIEAMLDEAVIIPASSFNTPTGDTPRNLLTWFYLAGAGFFLLKFLFNTVQVIGLIKRYGITREDGIRIVYFDRNLSPFSFFNIIFMNRSINGKDYREKIITHEINHIRKWHTIDLIVFELLTIIQWFNPVAWLYKWSLKEVHEYQADEAVIRGGHDSLNYQELVLSQVFGNQFFRIAHNLNQSLIKKRIVMMTKFKSSKIARYKIFLALPTALLIIALFSFTNNPPDLSEGINPNLSPALSLNISQDTAIYFVVDTMPKFQGGDIEKFRKYLARNLSYPKEAKDEGIAGNVFVQFVINTKGKVEQIAVVKGIHPLLDKEAVRVISESPDWEPGIKNGKEVNIAFTLPVSFVLNGKESQSEPEILPVDPNIPEEIQEHAKQDFIDPEIEEPVFFVVEQMPRFRGSDDLDAFRQYVEENLVYPEVGLKKGIDCMVNISFVVDKEGNVRNVKEVRDVKKVQDIEWEKIRAEFEKEGIRVVSSSPEWEPGVQRGHKVNVAFKMPFAFRLPANWEKQPLPSDIKESDELVFFVVEEMPKFQGSDDFNLFRKYIADHLVYPEKAAKKEIEGQVFIQFIVNRNGNIQDVKVIRSADPLLDQEALRVVNSSPSWEPGKQRGQKVNVAFTFPVVFKLSNEEPQE